MKLILKTTILFIFFLNSCILTQSHLQRGKNYFEKKQYERSIKELEKAANEDGDIYYYIETYSFLGDAYYNGGQANNALSVYRNALQIIHLRLREISARRHEVRRELNFRSNEHVRALQEEDMHMADEEWKLKARGEDINRKIKDVMEIM